MWTCSLSEAKQVSLTDDLASAKGQLEEQAKILRSATLREVHSMLETRNRSILHRCIYIYII